MRRKKTKPVGSRKTAILLGGMVALVCVCSAVFAVRVYHTRATQELKPWTLEDLAVALGRRCGYPLYLVASKGHAFFRWEDDKERFNVEAAIRGTDIYPDEHYHTYPFTITETDWRHEKFLQNHTPVEELSTFMFLRGVCFWAHNRFKEAEEAFTYYLRGFPESQFIWAYIAECQWRMNHEK
ncbi:MAG: hypothetical protein FWH21_04615 [Kiritimatiellaeota bacterium]|nr:hypothetical protein [Kiritimatiellota bacterium]